MPLLPTPCLIILPTSLAPPSSRPGRADSVERWDAHKKPSSPASSSGSSGSPGRASACERWDSNKTIKSPRGTSASSGERQRDSSKSPGRASSACERWDSSKRPPSRASSAERWDIHKKPRPLQTHEFDLEIDNHAQTDNGTKASTVATKETPAVFSGASFFASPEPTMLPFPSLLLAR